MSEHDIDELQPYERESDMPRELQRSLDPSARMQAGVDLAVTLIEGCDHAGLTLVQDGQITCGPGSDDVVAKADAIQDELGEGPCVDAARLEDRTIYVDDLVKASRWPRWAKQVTEELGIGSMLSLLLYTHNGSSEALNLYAAQGNQFTSEDFALAENLAVHLAVAVADGQEIEHRGKGMISRTTIGQAEGILMERYDIGPEEAFSFLRRASQESNRKVVEVAHDLVRTRTLPIVRIKSDGTGH